MGTYGYFIFFCLFVAVDIVAVVYELEISPTLTIYLSTPVVRSARIDQNDIG